MDDSDFTDFVAHRAPALLRTAFLLCGGDPSLRAALTNAAANRLVGTGHAGLPRYHWRKP